MFLEQTEHIGERNDYTVTAGLSFSQAVASGLFILKSLLMFQRLLQHISELDLLFSISLNPGISTGPIAAKYSLALSVMLLLVPTQDGFREQR